MNVDDFLRAEQLAIKTGNAVFAELDHREQLALLESGDAGDDDCRLHIDDIRRADGIADPATRALGKIDRLDHGAGIIG